MKRRNLLIGLLAAPVAAVVAKDIIEKISIDTTTPAVNDLPQPTDDEHFVTREYLDGQVNWEEIVAEPVPFDPNKHHHASDIEGFDELAARIEEVRRDMIWNKQKQVIAGWYSRGSA